jgi:hypothetical protein
MVTANTVTEKAAGVLLKAYEDKVSAQIQEVKAKLDQLEAKAKEKRAQAEIDAINKLKNLKQNIGQKVQDLKNTHDSNVTRAKADIDAQIATFKAVITELGDKLKAQK